MNNAEEKKDSTTSDIADVGGAARSQSQQDNDPDRWGGDIETREGDTQPRRQESDKRKDSDATRDA